MNERSPASRPRVRCVGASARFSGAGLRALRLDHEQDHCRHHGRALLHQAVSSAHCYLLALSPPIRPHLRRPLPRSQTRPRHAGPTRGRPLRAQLAFAHHLRRPRHAGLLGHAPAARRVGIFDGAGRRVRGAWVGSL